jgi:hypothetical protein
VAVAFPNTFEIEVPGVSEADFITFRAPESSALDVWVCSSPSMWQRHNMRPVLQLR